MKDILLLVIIPLIVVVVIAIFMIIKNHRLAQSSKFEDRVKKITRRPRVIRDNNHRDTEVNNLMVAEKSETFINNMKDFFRASILD